MSSIRRSITRSLAVALLLVCAVSFLALFVFMRARLIQQFDASLRTTAESVGALVQLDHGRIELDERDDALTEFRRPNRPSYFEVCDLRGNSLVRSASLTASLESAPGRPGLVAPLRLPDGRAGRVACVQITPSIESDDEDRHPAVARVEPVTVLVARDSLDLNSTLEWMAAALLVAVLGLLASVVIIIPPLVRRGLRPLDELSERASRLDATNLSERFATEAVPSELAPVGRRLNESLDRIAAAFARERRFAADAAHELRTPLAAIRANAEVARKWPDPEQIQSSINDIETASIRMQGLVERLLELARLGHAEPDQERRQIGLESFARDCVERCVPPSARQRCTLRIPADIAVDTQPELLGLLLDNLVSNALHHSPDTSGVDITVAAKTPVTLAVRNEAPHLNPEDLPRMFDPLWTKSADRSAGHAGLGLALVSEYARAMGMTVTPELADGRLTMVVAFPSS